MDTLGIDENGYPVIIEYKRTHSENVINQSLFYLDWLMDHRGDFELLVRDALGKDVALAIEWGAPRLICIASDFTKYDMHAVKQMSRNIELIRYRKFGDSLLLLDLLTAVSTSASPQVSVVASGAPTKATRYKTNAEIFKFHGCVDDIDQIVLTSEDYETFHKKKKFIAARLLSLFNEHPMLIVGYGARDPNVKALLSDIDEALLHYPDLRRDCPFPR